VESSRQFEPVPQPECPATVIHGEADEVVPIELSATWCQQADNRKLVRAPDDHSLTLGVSLRLIVAETVERFELDRRWNEGSWVSDKFRMG
jgi:pimeloyl-ACP methyl ester carboxylesterase